MNLGRRLEAIGATMTDYKIGENQHHIYDGFVQLCIAINNVEHVRQALLPPTTALNMLTKGSVIAARSEILTRSDQKIKMSIKQVAVYVANKVDISRNCLKLPSTFLRYKMSDLWFRNQN